MGAIPEPAEIISQRMGENKAEMVKKPNEMVKKGTLFDMTSGDDRVFAVAPFAHGFFENTEHIMTAELADMFERLFQESIFDNCRKRHGGCRDRVVWQLSVR
jgi:hypothetical protein